MAAVAIRGTTYPIVLPKLRDPRLHLAATITSLQVLGQVAFHFRLSITQILLSLLTCAVLEVAITAHRRHVLMWPASALLTGNGVAFVLRVPGTEHGDWWSFHGWYIFVATAAGALLSKYVIAWRGHHIFNPSNIGLVVCFLALGRTRAEPLDFWWGPMSWWMALALAIIVTGGFTILRRLHLLRVALWFWASFAAGIAVLAAAGHQMIARWHLGPVEGWHFFWVLVTSPEVLVFLFFMITDPKTAPTGSRARVAYAVTLGLLGALLIAPTHTEFAAKVALLSALAIVCAVKPLTALVPRRRLLLATAPAAAVGYAALLLTLNPASASVAAPAPVVGELPPLTILPSHGVQTTLSEPVAREIEQVLVSSPGIHATASDRVALYLEVSKGQDPPHAVAQLAGATYRLNQVSPGQWALGRGTAARAGTGPASDVLRGNRLVDVAASVGLDFTQGSFRYGISNDYRAMMGAGVCWLDYNNDGWEDLFAVNSYADTDYSSWQAKGGLPRSALFENVHGRFRNVSAASHADTNLRGDGCAAADLNGDGHPDLVLTTTNGAYILWNNGDGTFTTRALTRGAEAAAWYAGAAVADVNGDGRPDVFVAGYTDLSDPVPNSVAGFPTSFAGVRDLLFLNGGGKRFREVGVAAGLESADFAHGLGATFLDYNGDGRPDLYVANDEDPNQLYENVPWPGGARADPAGLGFRFEERAAAEGVADHYAGMGIAASDFGGDGRLDLFVTNSRREPSAAFRHLGNGTGPAFGNARPLFDPLLGTNFAGWGVSWVDLANSGSPDLVLTAGAIPVTSLAANAEPVRVLAPLSVYGGSQRFGDAAGVLPTGSLRLNGRGLAAADADNDGRVDVAINSIGGKLVLLRSTGKAGHWLEVTTDPVTPGASVTVTLPSGRRLTQEVQAGGSYLSSEDPRLHFGLGDAMHAATVVVRFPFGGTTTLRDVRADRLVVVHRPPTKTREPVAARTYLLAGCTPRTGGRSVAGVWNRAALAMLRESGASSPVQARDLFDLSWAVWDAWARGGDRSAAISYAAYRVLLSQASHGSNLAGTFSLLTRTLRSLCYSPDFVPAAGGSPAALGNRIAAAAIARGRTDGSLEAQGYVDQSFTPQNAPLRVSQAGSTVHDPTFWQPLALGSVVVQGLPSIPATVQTFEGAQWGRVRGFALSSWKALDPGPPPLGLSSGRAYRQAAVDVIRATAGRAAQPAPTTPVDWNALADSLSRGRLDQDVRVQLALNGALNDAAVAAWGAKRAYQSPRPISMIRYLAFNDQLPLVPGLIRRTPMGQIEVLERGRWVPGASWTPPTPTPSSPGWVSGPSAFAYAANEVLRGLTGRSLAVQAAQASRAGLANGIELRADETAGRRIGITVGKRALARALRYAP
jgi:Na+-translocating ferredoxin:NAD+ oxidoreductase RnfD subunit